MAKEKSKEEVIIPAEVVNLTDGKFLPQYTIPVGTKILDVSGNDLISIIDIIFPDGLETIILSRNKITSLEGMIIPTKLKKLDLRNNELHSLQDTQFPEVLEELYVVNNNFTHIEKEKFPHELKILDLSDNEILVPAQLNLPGNLVELKLIGCEIGSLHNIKLPASLERFYAGHNKIQFISPGILPEQIESVFLNDNLIESLVDISLPEGVIEFHCDNNTIESLEGFASISKLKKLNISCNSIKNLEGIDTLLPFLEILIIEENFVEELKIEKIPRGLKEFFCMGSSPKIFQWNEFPSGLETLMIESYRIDSLSDITFPSGLKKLYVSHNKIQSLQDVCFPEQLQELFLNCTSISSLRNVRFPNNLKVCELQASEIQFLEGFFPPTSLQVLDLTDNSFIQITENDLKILSSTMLTELETDEDIDSIDIVREFNHHQIEKIKSTLQFAQVFTPSSIIDDTSGNKLLKALIYKQYISDCTDVGLLEIMNELDVYNLKFLVVKYIQSVGSSGEGSGTTDNSKNLFSDIGKLPIEAQLMIFDYWLGEIFPITMVDFDQDFRLPHKRSVDERLLEDKNPKKLKVEKTTDDQSDFMSVPSSPTSNFLEGCCLELVGGTSLDDID